MADFEDITGWQDELEDYYEEFGQEGINYLYRHSRGILEQMVSLTQVQDYADLLMKHKEIRDALLVVAEWEKVKLAHGGIVKEGDPAHEDRPSHIYQLLSDFFEWYCMKTDFPVSKHQVHRWGENLAIGVLTGEFTSTKSEKFADFVKEENAYNAALAEKYK
ncbi:hypothetical protein ABVF61_05380 [Roseibium sp. HPY-6]|uniref:hypothetical protein n=1 Tax=Roseibium sp. HPY-6 TaxID=3229852 RepID=UPI00338FD25E